MGFKASTRSGSHLARLPSSGASTPDLNGTPPPSNHVFSPSFTISVAQATPWASVEDVNIRGTSSSVASNAVCFAHLQLNKGKILQTIATKDCLFGQNSALAGSSATWRTSSQKVDSGISA
jgi:hypothetical protein